MYKSKEPKEITIKYKDNSEKYLKCGLALSLEAITEKGVKKVKTDIAMLNLTKTTLEYAINRLQEILEEIK
ncbi:hypothetical protein [Clostridium sp.]|uniref:hypothetical protein n=1 Tax=Clostridium sp. TaxID=1506 RepID=UPI0025BAFDF1|nr:hypothetical protein [Clostridium sp.]